MMKRIVFALLAVVVAAGCKNQKPLLPSVSGKAGEVMVVIDKEQWDGVLGDNLRSILADEYPFLPTVEPRYSVVNVAPGAFGDLFKVHRNIVFMDIRPSAEPGLTIYRNKWANTQCVIQLSAASAAQADSLVTADGAKIVAAVEQAERDRVIGNTLKYENRDLHAVVKSEFGAGPHFPTGYKLKKRTPGFVWIADEKQHSIQGVFVYSYPARGTAEDFSMESLVACRNEVLEANVPGMFDGTFMTTGTYMTPSVNFVRYKGRSFAEMHGLWEVEGDYMGGPFVSHAFYSPDGSKIIVCEAWVFAPKFDKRQYLRQTESLLYSWE